MLVLAHGGKLTLQTLVAIRVLLCFLFGRFETTAKIVCFACVEQRLMGRELDASFGFFDIRFDLGGFLPVCVLELAALGLVLALRLQQSIFGLLPRFVLDVETLVETQICIFELSDFCDRRIVRFAFVVERLVDAVGEQDGFCAIFKLLIKCRFELLHFVALLVETSLLLPLALVGRLTRVLRLDECRLGLVGSILRCFTCVALFAERNLELRDATAFFVDELLRLLVTVDGLGAFLSERRFDLFVFAADFVEALLKFVGALLSIFVFFLGKLCALFGFLARFF